MLSVFLSLQKNGTHVNPPPARGWAGGGGGGLICKDQVLISLNATQTRGTYKIDLVKLVWLSIVFKRFFEMSSSTKPASRLLRVKAALSCFLLAFQLDNDLIWGTGRSVPVDGAGAS